MASKAAGVYFRRLFVAVYALATFAVVVSTTSTLAVAWDRRRVEARQGDNLSVTCTVPNLGPMSVVRIERRDDDRHTRMTLADNDDVKSPFAGHPRYHIEFSQRDGVGTITVNYNQIRGEDAGTLACYILMHDVKDENIATLKLVVLVPVQSVQLTMLFPDGREQVVITADDDDDDDGDASPERGDHRIITLTEQSLSTETIRPWGVQCVATVNGSLTPPSVSMMIDSSDVTGQFVVIEKSLIIEEEESETETSIGGGRIGLYYGETKLTYSTSLPNVTWNRRTLTCVASQEGFPNVIAAARVIVHYIPQITCSNREIAIDLGEMGRLVCLVKANPPPEVTWLFIDKNKTIENSIKDTNQFKSSFQVLSPEDHYEASMYITDVDVSQLGDYRLTAVNRIGRSEETVSIRLRRDKTVRERDSVHRPLGHAVTNLHEVSDSANDAACQMTVTVVVALLSTVVLFSPGH